MNKTRYRRPRIGFHWWRMSKAVQKMSWFPDDLTVATEKCLKNGGWGVGVGGFLDWTNEKKKRVWDIGSSFVNVLLDLGGKVKQVAKYRSWTKLKTWFLWAYQQRLGITDFLDENGCNPQHPVQERGGGNKSVCRIQTMCKFLGKEWPREYQCPCSCSLKTGYKDASCF